MSDELLERVVSSYMELGFSECGFAWQGGEPSLSGLDFYKKAIELQKKYSKDTQTVNNSFQTNAVLLDDEWCRFFNQNQFLVGISLDGPKQFHDYYRIDKAGKPTFERVIKAIETCRRNKAEFNILSLLNDKNVEHPDELFDFFVNEQKIKYLQFVPCVEKDPSTGRVAKFSISPEQFGDFFCRIFDRWCDHGPEKVSIRLFDSILSYYVRGGHTNCTFGRRCNDYVVIEHNGDVFCCDFFVEGDWCLGNILETPIGKLFENVRKREFADLKHEYGNKCFLCRYNEICQAGCLKDRTVLSTDFKNQSYFCQSYKKFFDHSLPKFMQLAGQLGSPS